MLSKLKCTLIRDVCQIILTPTNSGSAVYLCKIVKSFPYTAMWMYLPFIQVKYGKKIKILKSSEKFHMLVLVMEMTFTPYT